MPAKGQPVSGPDPIDLAQLMAPGAVPGNPTQFSQDPTAVASILQSLISGPSASSAPTPPAAGPASPIAPSMTDILDPTKGLQRMLAIPEVQSVFQNVSDLQNRMKVADLRQQQLATPRGQVVPGTAKSGVALAGDMPRTAWSPNFTGSVPHKIGQALLAVLASTRPGQAIQDVIYQQPQEELARKVAAAKSTTQDLKDQLGAPTEELRSISQMTGASNAAIANMIRSQREQDYRQSVQNHLEIAKRGLDIKGILAGSTVALNNAKIGLDNAVQAILPQKLALGYTELDARRDIADQMRQTEMAKSPGFLKMLDSWVGGALSGTTPPEQERSKPPAPRSGPGRRVVDLTQPKK